LSGSSLLNTSPEKALGENELSGKALQVLSGDFSRVTAGAGAGAGAGEKPVESPVTSESLSDAESPVTSESDIAPPGLGVELV
jgi:hypothetical protein